MPLMFDPDDLVAVDNFALISPILLPWLRKTKPTACICRPKTGMAGSVGSLRLTSRLLYQSDCTSYRSTRWSN